MNLEYGLRRGLAVNLFDKQLEDARYRQMMLRKVDAENEAKAKEYAEDYVYDTPMNPFDNKRVKEYSEGIIKQAGAFESQNPNWKYDNHLRIQRNQIARNLKDNEHLNAGKEVDAEKKKYDEWVADPKNASIANSKSYKEDPNNYERQWNRYLATGSTDGEAANRKLFRFIPPDANVSFNDIVGKASERVGTAYKPGLPKGDFVVKEHYIPDANLDMVAMSMLDPNSTEYPHVTKAWESLDDDAKAHFVGGRREFLRESLRSHISLKNEEDRIQKFNPYQKDYSGWNWETDGNTAGTSYWAKMLRGEEGKKQTPPEAVHGVLTNIITVKGKAGTPDIYQVKPSADNSIFIGVPTVDKNGNTTWKPTPLESLQNKIVKVSPVKSYTKFNKVLREDMNIEVPFKKKLDKNKALVDMDIKDDLNDFDLEYSEIEDGYPGLLTKNKTTGDVEINPKYKHTGVRLIKSGNSLVGIRMPARMRARYGAGTGVSVDKAVSSASEATLPMTERQRTEAETEFNTKGSVNSTSSKAYVTPSGQEVDVTGYTEAQIQKAIKDKIIKSR